MRDVRKPLWALRVLMIAFVWPEPGLAQESGTVSNAPGLLVSPTYVLLDGHTRSQAVLLSNRGNAPETYRITIVNRLQKADGQLVEANEPLKGEGSAAPLVRYAPREIVLPPNRPQTVRLLLQVPPDLPDGEYRSHILFQQVPTVVARDTATQVAPGISVTIRAVFGITIPLIVRKGNLTAQAALSDFHLVHDAEGHPGLALKVERSGTRSLRGDVTVLVDGEQAGLLKNVNVFLSTPYRELTIPLTFSGDLRGHKIAVKFAEDEELPGAASAIQALAP